MWHMCAELHYDIIYLLTAIVLTPVGRSTVNIYTQTIHRTTHLTTRTTQLTIQLVNNCTVLHCRLGKCARLHCSSFYTFHGPFFYKTDNCFIVWKRNIVRKTNNIVIIVLLILFLIMTLISYVNRN
jgi:hypothetical protein